VPRPVNRKKTASRQSYQRVWRFLTTSDLKIYRVDTDIGFQSTDISEVP
jgi:hypothetical protein